MRAQQHVGLSHTSHIVYQATCTAKGIRDADNFRRRNAYPQITTARGQRGGVGQPPLSNGHLQLRPHGIEGESRPCPCLGIMEWRTGVEMMGAGGCHLWCRNWNGLGPYGQGDLS